MVYKFEMNLWQLKLSNTIYLFGEVFYFTFPCLAFPNNFQHKKFLYVWYNTLLYLSISKKFVFFFKVIQDKYTNYIYTYQSVMKNKENAFVR